MAAASFAKIGIKAAVYRNSGTYASPTWAAVPLTRDVQVSAPWDMADASSRGSRVKLYAKTLMDITITITLRKDDADTQAVAILAAAMGGTAVDFLVLDGLISVEGSSGFRGPMHVNFASEDQGAGSVIYTNYELKPAFVTAAPIKAVVTGSGSALTESDPGS